MLNREICLICWRHLFKDALNGNMRNDKHDSEKCITNGKPNDKCPYYLEHLLTGQKMLNRDGVIYVKKDSL